MATPKTTSSITFGNLTTIQIALTGAEFSDDQALDDLGGPGPYLVFERGIYKYPLQDAGGRIAIPRAVGRPVRLFLLQANLGAEADLEVHVAGIDDTAQRPLNETGEPYLASNAALYAEGDIIADSFTATQYISRNYNTGAADPAVIIFPGQQLYLVSSGASDPLVRVTFSLGWDLL
jgi:hypothetical protein